MNILITNRELDRYSGSTLYVKELALSLKKRGEVVQVYTFIIGKIGKELMKEGIFVTNNLKKITFYPDIIHAHHNITTIDVVSYFRNSPVVLWIHDRLNKMDHPFLHKNILKYVAVDYNCKERYEKDSNFDPSDSEVIYNWVNLERFKLKKHINKKPKKALVFSNYAKDNNHLTAIKSACEKSQISIDVIGIGSGNIKYDPENHLANYDIIFAKAKAAMESITTGAGVIVCDFTGLAGFVTSNNVAHYRKYNFGMKLMKFDITPANIINEIRKYDASDIKNVSKIIRADIDIHLVIDQLLDLYKNCIEDYKNNISGKYNLTIKNFLYVKFLKLKYLSSFHLKQEYPFLFMLLKRIKNIPKARAVFNR